MKTYNLSLDENVVHVVWAALHKAPMPREITDLALSSIKRQIEAQEAPAKNESGAGHKKV